MRWVQWAKKQSHQFPKGSKIPGNARSGSKSVPKAISSNSPHTMWERAKKAQGRSCRKLRSKVLTRQRSRRSEDPVESEVHNIGRAQPEITPRSRWKAGGLNYVAGLLPYIFGWQKRRLWFTITWHFKKSQKTFKKRLTNRPGRGNLSKFAAEIPMRTGVHLVN